MNDYFKIDLEIPEEIINELEKMALDKKISMDELMISIIREFISSKKTQNSEITDESTN